MELTFATPALEATANSSLKLDKRFGVHADLVRQRLSELAAAENLAVARDIPTLGFTALPAGDFAIAVGRAGQIRFASVAAGRGASPRARDLQAITTIQILAIG